MPEKLLIEISPGELIDKITILEIKLLKVNQKEKLKNIRLEHEALTKTRNSKLKNSEELTQLTESLRKINERLWNIEDDIRDCERSKIFSQVFIDLARSVYVNNDNRARLKREINDYLGSNLVEEKSYANY